MANALNNKNCNKRLKETIEDYVNYGICDIK